MGETREIPSVTTTFKGVFDFNELVSTLAGFLKDKGFKALEKDAPEDAFETYYLQKGAPKTNYKMIWETTRSRHDYVKQFLKVDFTGRGIEETEIAWEGQKLKVHKGELSVKISGNIELDPKGEWEKSWFLKNFSKLYEKKLAKSDINGQMGMLQGDMGKANDIVKKFFKMMGKEPEVGLPPHI